MGTRPAEKRYTIEDLKPVIAGEVALPNAEPIEPGALLNTIAAGGHSLTPEWGWALWADGSGANRKQWTQYFLRPTPMGGRNSFGGEGYAIIYNSRWVDGKEQGAITLRFALCKHEKVEGPGANHSRGWHPGWCGKCGMNMTVDSGD